MAVALYIFTIMLQMVQWSSFLVSEWLDLLVSSVKVTIVLELYRRKWQGGNIYYLVLIHGKWESDRQTSMADQNSTGQISSSELATQIRTSTKTKFVAKVGTVQLIQIYVSLKKIFFFAKMKNRISNNNPVLGHYSIRWCRICGPKS